MNHNPTSFRFPCYKNFLKSLGRFDAICNYSTLAVDLLNERLKSEGDPRKWLSETAKSRGIILHQVEVRLLPVRLVEMYIMLVYAELEEFLTNYENENWESAAWKERSAQSKLQSILSNLGIRHSKVIEKDRDIIEYYRLVRNRIAHPLRKAKKLHKERDDLRNLLGVLEDSAAPSKPEDLGYADFNLFTRAAKRMALKLCEIGRPSDSDIAIHIMPEIRALNRFRTKPNRFRKAVRQYLHMRFQLDSIEADPIIDEILGC